MCSICWQAPCHPRCPNAPEEKPVAYCRRCHGSLFTGDKHFDGICEECLADMNPSQWLELFEETLKEI